jgi:steroid delta-isomerase-like uncharacterized protein
MSQAPDTMVREWFEQLWNQKREDTIDRLLAPHGLVYGLPTPDNQPLRGPDEFKAVYRQFRQAFPNLTIIIERTVREGDLAALHCRVTGKHEGEGLGVPPSGRTVNFTGMCFVRAEGDQFVEGWNCFDFQTCFQQIGAAAPLSPAAK